VFPASTKESSAKLLFSPSSGDKAKRKSEPEKEFAPVFALRCESVPFEQEKKLAIVLQRASLYYV
jgi:hypothetical protein